MKINEVCVAFFNREETESRDSSFSDSFSDESESEKLSRWDGCSSEEGDSLWHMNDRWGYLYFQYFERSTPYGRVPLMDKVSFFYLFASLAAISLVESLLFDTLVADALRKCMW